MLKKDKIDRLVFFIHVSWGHLWLSTVVLYRGQTVNVFAASQEVIHAFLKNIHFWVFSSVLQ